MLSIVSTSLHRCLLYNFHIISIQNKSVIINHTYDYEEKSNTAIVIHEYVRGLYVAILTQTVCELDNYLAPSGMLSYLRDGFFAISAFSSCYEKYLYN